MGKDFKYQVKINNKKSIQETMALMESRQKEMYEPIGTIQYINDYIKKQIDKENEIVESAVFEEIRKFGINIDKDELIKALNYDRQQYEKGYQDGFNANKWIPCSERLPETDSDVLLHTTYFGIVVGKYEKIFDKYGNAEMKFLIHKSISNDDMASVDVIAWQPLPEPYDDNEESDDDE